MGINGDLPVMNLSVIRISSFQGMSSGKMVPPGCWRTRRDLVSVFSGGEPELRDTADWSQPFAW